jgi:protein-tyrosine phosphatase
MPARTSADYKETLVLFICTGNFYRSRHAEAIFSIGTPLKRAVRKGFFKGFINIHCSGRTGTLISTDTEERLKTLGVPLELTRPSPVQLRAKDLKKAHHIIALKKDEHYEMMLSSHPEWADKIHYWHMHDIDFEDPQTVLPKIEEEVLNLLIEKFKIKT